MEKKALHVRNMDEVSCFPADFLRRPSWISRREFTWHFKEAVSSFKLKLKFKLSLLMGDV